MQQHRHGSGPIAISYFSNLHEVAAAVAGSCREVSKLACSSEPAASLCLGGADFIAVAGFSVGNACVFPWSRVFFLIDGDAWVIKFTTASLANFRQISL